jgi:signal recognition particle subunit SRP54
VDINRLLKQYDMMQQMVRQMAGSGKRMKKFGKMGAIPGLGF